MPGSPKANGDFFFSREEHTSSPAHTHQIGRRAAAAGHGPMDDLLAFAGPKVRRSSNQWTERLSTHPPELQASDPVASWELKRGLEPGRLGRHKLAGRRIIQDYHFAHMKLPTITSREYVPREYGAPPAKKALYSLGRRHWWHLSPARKLQDSQRARTSPLQNCQISREM